MHLFPQLMRPDLIPEAKPLKNDAILGLPFTALGAGSFEGHEVAMPQEYDEVYNSGVGKGVPTCLHRHGFGRAT